MEQSLVYTLKLTNHDTATLFIYAHDKEQWHISGVSLDGDKIIDEVKLQMRRGLHGNMPLPEVLIKMFGTGQCLPVNLKE